jgi:hypothetical protein
MQMRTVSCNCGNVRLQMQGNPIRIGICHCQICRRQTGSCFNFFAVWTAEHVAIFGKTKSWKHTTDHRHFCGTCGSSVFGIVDGSHEVEIAVGAFDEAPSDLSPSYELWIGRREGWLQPIDGTEQYIGDRKA